MPVVGDVQTQTRRATTQLNELIAELKHLNVEISVKESKRPKLSPEDADALQKSLIGLVRVSRDVRVAQGPSGLLELMDWYISDPTEENWKRMVRQAEVVRDKIHDAQLAFFGVNNIYIFEKSHEQFLNTFSARTSYVYMILNADKPIDAKLFRTYRNAYAKLITTLEDLIENLRAYGHEFVHSSSQADTTTTVAVAPPPDLRGRTLFIMPILAAVASVLFALFGVWLVALGSSALGTELKLFGQSIKTQSVGVACVFIGAVALVIIFRRVMRSLDRS